MVTSHSTQGDNRSSLRFPPTLAGLDAAATSLRQLLAARALNDGPRYNVELVVEEIAGNIIRHGRPTADVDLAISFDDDEIVLTFEDNGMPFDPREQTAPSFPESIETAQVGGLGLVLVRKVSTRIEYSRTTGGRNQLTLAVPAR